MKRWLVFVALCALSFACTAQTLVYRMDTRPPVDVFPRGMAPPGDNTNLYRHVMGQTCYHSDRTSGFIATTTDPQFAVDWGSEILPAGGHFYVYRIRPTARFYRTTTSLMHAYAVTHTMAYQRAASTFVEQQEWASRGTIPPETIVDAIEYTSLGPGRAPQRVTTHVNRRYVHAPSVLTEAPYSWDYREDEPRAPDSPDAVCGTSCFGFSLFGSRGKRDATMATTMRNVLACRREVVDRTSALLSLFDDAPLIEEILDKE